MQKSDVEEVVEPTVNTQRMTAGMGGTFNFSFYGSAVDGNDTNSSLHTFNIAVDENTDAQGRAFRTSWVRKEGRTNAISSINHLFIRLVAVLCGSRSSRFLELACSQFLLL